jgi:hypothetical protein
MCGASTSGPHNIHNMNNMNTNHNLNTSAMSNSNPDGTNNCDDSNQTYAPMPKHIAFPDVPHSPEILNELLIFVFTIVSAGGQFMHLYRTVWWLPDSFTHQIMNLYLIDTYLAIFIVVILGRRLIFCGIYKLLELLCPEKLFNSVYSLVRFVFFEFLILVLGGCTVKIFQNHSYVYTICLCYPLLLYAAIFGFNIEPFLRTINETETTYLNQIPMHCCSTNTTTVRNEVDNLIIDFNNRFKQIIFTSVVNAYYAGFIPCFFAQKYLYYDKYWTIQHLAFIWAFVFAMNVTYCFPAKYSDILHRAALHLGQWNKIELRTYLQSPITWTKQTFWPPGTVIKHSDKFYKSNGFITSAIPSNSSHFRFYLIFNNPSHLYLFLSIIQLAIVVVQIFLLHFMSTEWHNILSLTFLLFVNNITLFKLFRDYLVTNKIYSAELSIYKKIHMTGGNAASSAATPGSSLSSA